MIVFFLNCLFLFFFFSCFGLHDTFSGGFFLYLYPSLFFIFIFFLFSFYLPSLLFLLLFLSFFLSFLSLFLHLFSSLSFYLPLLSFFFSYFLFLSCLFNKLCLAHRLQVAYNICCLEIVTHLSSEQTHRFFISLI